MGINNLTYQETSRKDSDRPDNCWAIRIVRVHRVALVDAAATVDDSCLLFGVGRLVVVADADCCLAVLPKMVRKRLVTC